jgi:dihydrofolate synthase / folylpolyglutamate synthase
MNYPDSVQYLYALGNETKNMKFGLERISTVLEALGNPQDTCRMVHVAGTNGKGSVCAMVESGLRAAGRRTGMFTSPHLVEPTERIQINGVPTTTELFADAFRQVHEAAERLLERGAIDIHPTYFETVAAMAFLVFRAEGVDTVALEVGLGGRLDATNVVKPAICAITRIEFDHMAMLGHTIGAIAAEKAGILKQGVPAVFAAQHPEGAEVLERRARELAVPYTWASRWQAEDLELAPDGSKFRAEGPISVNLTVPLRGGHQVENALIAVDVLHRMGIPAEAIARGLAATHWDGRLERLRERPSIYLDGAHNPSGARALARYIQQFYQGRRIWMIFGAMADKDIEHIAGELFPLATDLIVTCPHMSRAQSPEKILAIRNHPNARLEPDPKAALALVRNAGPDDAVFITGSLYLAGEMRSLLLAER